MNRRSVFIGTPGYHLELAGSLTVINYSAAFLNALASILPDSVHSHLSKRCTAVRAAVDGSDRARLRFADGSTYEADVVIGADGIKSVIRTQIFGSGDDHLVDTGASAYRGQVHTKDLLDAGLKEETLRSPLLWMGTDKHLVTYPIMDGSLLNVAACPLDYTRAKIPTSLQASWPAWVMKVTQQEMLDAFSDFGHDARIILEQLKEPSKWTMHGLYPPLESYVAPAKFESGVGGEGTEDNQNRLIGNMNVVLIGDAAHAMLPFLGAGAGAGIEDAYVLASLLAHPQTCHANLSFVLRAYDSIRVPRAAYIAEKSRRAGEVLHGRGPSGPSVAGRWNDIESQWDKIWNTDVKVDVANAVAALEEGGVFDSQE
ncbi:FAD/NAD(P)-binding domain-containing protein [Peniophora sp. CONT]|nr:FAD/NAD(P)-binding domain-containing protein [Peniophora sp. CONT]